MITRAAHGVAVNDYFENPLCISLIIILSQEK